MYGCRRGQWHLPQVEHQHRCDDTLATTGGDRKSPHPLRPPRTTPSFSSAPPPSARVRALQRPLPPRRRWRQRPGRRGWDLRRPPSSSAVGASARLVISVGRACDCQPSSHRDQRWCAGGVGGGGGGLAHQRPHARARPPRACTHGRGATPHCPVLLAGRGRTHPAPNPLRQPSPWRRAERRWRRPLAPPLRKRRPRRGGEGSTGEESWRKSSRRWLPTLPPRPLTALDGSHRRPRWDIRTCTAVLYKFLHGLRPYDVGGVRPLPATRCTTSRWMDGRAAGAGEYSLQGEVKKRGRARRPPAGLALRQGRGPRRHADRPARPLDATTLVVLIFVQWSQTSEHSANRVVAPGASTQVILSFASCDHAHFQTYNGQV